MDHWTDWWKQRAAEAAMKGRDFSESSSEDQHEHHLLFRGFHPIKDPEYEKVRGEIVSEKIGDQEIEGYWFSGIGIHYPQAANHKGSCWIQGDMHVANDWISVVPETVEIKLGNNPWFPIKFLTAPLPAEMLPQFADRPYWHVSLRESGDGWKIMPAYVAANPMGYNYGSCWLAYATEPKEVNI